MILPFTFDFDRGNDFLDRVIASAGGTATVAGENISKIT